VSARASFVRSTVVLPQRWLTWSWQRAGWIAVLTLAAVLYGFRRYYLILLGPSIAALVGAGLVALWREYRRASWRGWLLPLVLVATAALQARSLANYPDWNSRLTLPMVSLCAATAVVRVAARLWRRLPPITFALAASTAGLALLVAPAVWSAYPVLETGGMRNLLPFGGPPPAGLGSLGGLPCPGSFDPPAGLPPPPGPNSAASDPPLLSYLQAHRGQARFLLAIPIALPAAPIILATGEPVMALGGFIDSHPILSEAELATLVADGIVRFFLLPSPDGLPFPQAGPGPGRPRRGDPTRWVGDHCATVSPNLWRSISPMRPRARWPARALQRHSLHLPVPTSACASTTARTRPTAAAGRTRRLCRRRIPREPRMPRDPLANRILVTVHSSRITNAASPSITQTGVAAFAHIGTCFAARIYQSHLALLPDEFPRVEALRSTCRRVPS
jgi:hypothetical protein